MRVFGIFQLRGHLAISIPTVTFVAIAEFDDAAGKRVGEEKNENTRQINHYS